MLRERLINSPEGALNSSEINWIDSSFSVFTTFKEKYRKHKTMVEANSAGDGIQRHIEYAVWRQDKEPSEGYSRELISVKVDKKHYDDLDAIPHNKEGQHTIISAFR